MIVPLFIGRSNSLKALEDTMAKEKMVVFASQIKEDVEDPSPKDICKIGTLSEIVQILSLPDGSIKVLVEGLCRVKVEKYVQKSPYLRVEVSRIEDPDEVSVETEALVRKIIKLFEEYVKLNRRIPSETLLSIINVDSPGKLADLVASYLSLRFEEKQSVLEALAVEARLTKLSEILDKEIKVLEVENNLQGKVRQQIEKVQKEYYLKEKMRAIQEELGEEEEDYHPEASECRKKIEKARLPEEVKKKAKKDLERLTQMPPMVAEAAVIRTYLDWLTELPWKKKTNSKLDIDEVEKILDEDHHGLKKVKERILEYFAVLKLTKKMGGTILCLVGPPGVGKTSVARSIARAMGRKFTRFALGGVRDEAEIRGHRRTYVGSMPGRIIQSIHKVGVNNPVFLLDEVDKMGADFRGDPTAALLEVLDPEMNKEFSDHYLEVPFDLSDVFFITTANTMEPIPKPLRDRMEIIQMFGYTEEEKLGIARGYVIPRELTKHGLSPRQVEFEDEAVLSIIREYTREAGVRNLQRQVDAVLRKIATKVVKIEGQEKAIVKKNDLAEYLGAPRYHYGVADAEDQVGTVTGLVWTEVGGDTTPVEVTIMPGRGDLILTGMMGDVMQESSKAAMSYVRSQAKDLGLEEKFYRKIDVHIHVPEGAVPKDGPSAGITIATALTSALTKVAVKRNVAMTGEITLRGRVLSIGGLKEKLLAARRAGMETVIIPQENETNFADIKSEIPEDLKIVFAREMREVLDAALVGKIKSPDKARDKRPYRYMPGPEPPAMYA
ncbi:endopeptidase La [candidate division WOR-1 bacterium RIFCSPLOWO2_02_FULL_46_20]|uniref:Lon protease n=2 Tax=Saganbacteria TaxID=1703751 RepID=A0A1F4R3K6_UNCSA|nr:MAG: endopeptidase La [candidate division WOR-1 bacterium RIFCSPHIGHO2_02_FULL_45_12]OGC02825.1 MAG: endopeptidase La [candidate division WOR-1 bacterium RIFCSPLOWO2_02_FULL_46_20]OGC08351.1 MAG: endopeptidase La [candidate division WOR-1 bacterium RIFCSPLOWO2_12_FULL_45_9]